MTLNGGATLAVAALLLGACASLPDAPAAPAVTLSGYLPDTIGEQLATAILPGPSGVSSQDRAGSDRYRPLEGGDRWLMAIAHAELRPPYVAQHFDCAVGARLTAEPMPALTRLMTRLQLDALAVGTIARDRNPRPRPAALDPQRRVCLRLTAAGRASGRPMATCSAVWFRSVQRRSSASAGRSVSAAPSAPWTGPVT